ncbi:MAG: hypothetical protein Q9190_002967, partial [Brigantiaea leucoxantha]
MDQESRNEIISSHGHLIASSQSPVTVKERNLHSAEDSGPPSPSTGPATNFALVAPGIYRSGFPMAGNFEHLKSLNLKTILSLVGQGNPVENSFFMEENGIQHFQVPIAAHKRDTDLIPIQ